MTDVNDALVDQSIRHAIFVERYKGGLYNRVVELFEEIEKDIVSRIDSYSDTKRIRLKILLKDIREIVNSNKWDNLTREELLGFVKQEALFTTATLSASFAGGNFTKPSSSLLRELVLKEPILGELLSTHFKETNAKVIRNINRQIRLGISQGESIDEIVRRIRGVRTNNFKDAIVRKSFKDVRSVVNTAVTHTTINARVATYVENGINRYKWLSTLDSRTSLICVGLDGKILVFGEDILPPAHYNCRSVISPIIENNIFGDFIGQRASVNGPVRGDMTMTKFLRNQPRDFRIETLGVTRTRLFDAGMPVEFFTDKRQNILTLDDLAQRREKWFIKAGLDVNKFN